MSNNKLIDTNKGAIIYKFKTGKSGQSIQNYLQISNKYQVDMNKNVNK